MDNNQPKPPDGVDAPTGFDGASILWLIDAPLFIDAPQIAASFDAVVRPRFAQGKVTFEWNEGKAQKLAGKQATTTTAGGGATGKFDLGWLGKAIGLPGVTAEANAKLEQARSGENTQEESATTETKKTAEQQEISNPYRQLLLLTAHYAENFYDRLLLLDQNEMANETWREPKNIAQSPRCLAFFDLPGREEAVANQRPETKLIPIAAEFEDGEVVLLYSLLKSKDGSGYPGYPEPKPGMAQAELLANRREYWQWFDTNFSATQAMLLIEETCRRKNQALRWIDYRVPLTADGTTLHLHLVPDGKFNTGVFAYNFIKRGYEHGLRLVGSLKSGPDLNVLAAFEK